MSATPPHDPNADAHRRGARDVKRAIAFGVIAATVQMAILLWLMFS